MECPGPAPRCRGFTLTEVVLAIGIISFGIVAVIGLLSVSLEASRESSDDTRLAAMTTLVIDRLRSRPFADLPPAESITFDIDGNEVSPAPGSGDAYYDCDVVLIPAPGALSTHLKRVEVRFSWPDGVTPAPNERTVHATIAHR